MLKMTADRLNAIRRASRALLGFFIFLSAISVLGTLNQIAHPFPPGTRTLAGVAFQDADISGKIQLLWLVQIVLNAALTLKILYHLVKLMGSFSKGELFTAQNVAQVRQVGLTLLCASALWFLVLIGAAPEIAAAQDQWVRIMPSFPGGALVLGAILLFASGIMNEGRELREEQDLVV
jgi:hypothetical protein